MWLHVVQKFGHNAEHRLEFVVNAELVLEMNEEI